MAQQNNWARPQCRNTQECPAGIDLVLVSLSFGQIKSTCRWSVSHTGVSLRMCCVWEPQGCLEGLGFRV